MFKLLVQVLVLFMFSLPATADYVVQVIDIKHKETNEEKTVLHVYGDFDLGISNDVRTALNIHADKIDEAVLNSPGGLGYEGYQVGAILSEYQVKTRVASGTACLSACAVAFIGGQDYEVEGILGFHKGHLAGQEPFLNQEEAFDNGQQAGSFNLYYIIANGFGVDLGFQIDRRSSPSHFVVFTNTEDLMKFYVRSDEDYIANYVQPIQETPLVFDVNDMVTHLTNNPNDGLWKPTLSHFKKEHIESKDNV